MSPPRPCQSIEMKRWHTCGLVASLLVAMAAPARADEPAPLSATCSLVGPPGQLVPELRIDNPGDSARQFEVVVFVEAEGVTWHSEVLTGSVAAGQNLLRSFPQALPGHTPRSCSARNDAAAIEQARNGPGEIRSEPQSEAPPREELFIRGQPVENRDNGDALRAIGGVGFGLAGAAVGTVAGLFLTIAWIDRADSEGEETLALLPLYLVPTVGGCIGTWVAWDAGDSESSLGATLLGGLAGAAVGIAAIAISEDGGEFNGALPLLVIGAPAIGGNLGAILSHHHPSESATATSALRINDSGLTLGVPALRLHSRDGDTRGSLSLLSGTF